MILATITNSVSPFWYISQVSPGGTHRVFYMKDTFYFSHDYNARNDWKLVKVMMKHWVTGIWIYWCIVEMLYEEWWVLMLSECERIAFELRTSCEVVESILNDFDLFRNDWTWFYSKSILDRIEQRNIKSEKARSSAEKRWKDKGIDANALRTQSESNAIKERKGNERKGKEIKTDTISIDTEQAPKYAMVEIEQDEESKEIHKHLLERTVEIAKETYWKEEINMMQSFLRKAVGVTQFKDSKERWYVQHCYNLLKKIWREDFNTRLQEILSDPFKAKNCNKLAYLYWEMKSYIHTPVVEPQRRWLEV